MPVKPPDPNSRASASAEDADNHLTGQNAAEAEQARIESWTKPNFANGGRQQLQMDESFGRKERT